MYPEVLLSAMHLESENYIDTLGIHTDCVLINQCDRESVRKAEHDTPQGRVSVTYIETRERGLSKSRNMAVSNATGPVCILCDNDIRYEDDASEEIVRAFLRHPEAGIICFFIERPERSRPPRVVSV